MVLLWDDIRDDETFRLPSLVPVTDEAQGGASRRPLIGLTTTVAWAVSIQFGVEVSLYGSLSLLESLRSRSRLNVPLVPSFRFPIGSF